MSEFSVKEVFSRRLPLYAYLEPLLAGRRVVELGSGTGEGAAYLAAHGAAEVTAIDTDGAAVERARARHTAPNITFRVAGGLLDVVPAAPFDVVVVPEAEAVLRRPDAVPALARLVAPGGRLVLVASSADRGSAGAGGLGYYELTDALLPQFPAVQMFGVTPFAGFGVVEFDVDGDGLRVDSRLVEGGAEAPAAYVAVAGSSRAAELGYALVQVPFAPIEARLSAVAEVDDRGATARLSATERRLDEVEKRSRVRVEEAEARAGELRRKLDDAGAEAESALRVARAQGAEIEELRGRLRRASEDRAALDGELSKLRRALAEADESVMNLTRKTAEEMSAVAARLSESLRAPAPREDTQRLRLSLSEAESRASAAEQRLEEVAAVGRERQAALDDVVERLKMAEETTARERSQVSRLRAQLGETTGVARLADERETTLARRDERIATLEGEKQELVWRLAEFEEKLRQTIGRAVISDRTDRAQADELESARASRSKAMEDFHRVAGAHVGELTALRASVAEQSALVAELEEALRVAEGAASTATAELATLRKNTKGLEEADRTRRTRLAELEGKLLRLEHERKQALQAGAGAAAASDGGAAAAELQRRLDAATRERDAAGRERDELRGNLARVMGAAAESAEALARTTAELGSSRARVATLETEMARLGNGKNGNGHAAEGAATARELHAIEAGLRDELRALTQIESALAEELASAGRPSDRRPEAELEAGAGADAILLHATLGNYRRHAARLRDELEGVRRRLDSLSPSEISGYLEELGEDLAEMEE